MSWNGRFDAALHRWWDQAPIAAEALDSDPCHFCSDTRPDFVEWAMQSSDFVWTRWMRCSFTRIFLELHAELDWEALDAPWAGTSVRAALRSGREQYVDSRLYQQAQRIAQKHADELAHWFEARIRYLGEWPRQVLEASSADRSESDPLEGLLSENPESPRGAYGSWANWSRFVLPRHRRHRELGRRYACPPRNQ